MVNKKSNSHFDSATRIKFLPDSKRSNSHFDSATRIKFLPDSKRSQSQIISTVLIILLVLAAIVIVWQVVNSTVREGAKEAKGAASCIGLNLDVVSAEAKYGVDNPATAGVDESLTQDSVVITVTRKSGSEDTEISGFKFLVDQSVVSNEPSNPADKSIKVFETKKYEWTTAGSFPFTEGGKTVEIAPILKTDGRQCDPIASVTSVKVA